MKHQLTLILAAAGLAMGNSSAATLDLSSLGGTLALGYTDTAGIVGLNISYTIGQDPGTSESSGFSEDTGGMSLPVTGFPDGHLAVGPGDVVTLDFSATSGVGEVFIGLFDLDNNTFGGDEGVTVTSAEGSVFEPGFGADIDNARAIDTNVFNVGPITPDANGKITLTASTALEQADGSLSISSGNGYFAFTVDSNPVVPEPSSALLGLLGLASLAMRRRR
ncbi:PEP-CTERM sorting domain-containing protein [Verrucomicrobiales bacterium]|jgi:MYXO-CTERM domain-containing protein|nr:PEP-CTERM sorting domain-containing protein [Verrucomicrobiales bacterium]MDF1785281.1 PEP-CTERM sorting domain-containing protein [Verrucomicrobiales bacterium]